MMFNKILVLGDQHVNIQDYKSLAQYVFKNLNPATDISFSQGPMDVLDHSCSKLGFGGKMCIDGTFKYDEEKDEQYYWSEANDQLATRIIELFPEVKAVNDALVNMDIPVLIVSVEKSRKGHIKDLHHEIAGLTEAESVKMILYVEHTVDANDLPIALWRFCNNLDPRRDQVLVERASSTVADKMFACIGLDGTIKTKELDGFMRDWPNIIVSDDATIQSVDEKWGRLGLGEFIPSPSLKFKSQLYGNEAVVQ